MLRSARPVSLEDERHRRYLSRRVAAHSIGVSVQTLQRAEAGGSVSAKAAQLISDFYGVPVEAWHPKLRRKDLP